MYTSIASVLGRIPPAWGVRCALIAYTIIIYGIAADLKWHRMFPLREFYFIPPHIIIYAGITILLIALSFLRWRRYEISLWAFVAYPLLSVFDEFWHRTFGIELATSPLAFWSPAHWSFSVVTWYILFLLYRLDIEPVRILKTFIEATIFMIIPVRLLMYVAVPVAPYTHIEYLSTWLNHCVTILPILVMSSIHFILKRDDVLLISVLILSAVSGPYVRLFFDPDHYLSHSTLVKVLLFIVLILLVTCRKSRALYIVLAMIVGLSVYIVDVFSGDYMNMPRILFTVLSSALCGSLYYDTERYCMHLVTPTQRGRLATWVLGSKR